MRVSRAEEESLVRARVLVRRQKKLPGARGTDGAERGGKRLLVVRARARRRRRRRRSLLYLYEYRVTLRYRISRSNARDGDGFVDYE